MSRTADLLGHLFMTNSSSSPDLAAIAREADLEIQIAEAVKGVGAEDQVLALSTVELGYYEAELDSLRDAAARTDEAEHETG